jgi:signal transduction histidine kinase
MILQNKNIPCNKVVAVKREKSKKGFSKEQKLFVQLLRNYPDGAISIIDANYNFIITGGDLHKRLAADPSELIGNQIYPKFPEHIREIIKEKLKLVFDGKTISTFELQDVIKGEVYVLNAFPLREKDGTISCAGVIIRNISHLKVAERELKNALEKERELSEMKSRFITMASHEFKTPLSTMLSSVQLLKKYRAVEAQDKVEKHLTRIESSIQVLNDLLNDFLTVGKIQEGIYTNTPSTFNIKEHITAIKNQFDNKAKEGQQIIYKHSGDEMVFLDPLLLHHIVTNLLSNALKFSTKKVLAEVTTQWLQHRLVLSVKDYGIGIPLEYRQHLFEQFYRASNATNIQGTGLGLYTTSKYVALMNGTICYTSELEKGSEFVITF